MFYNISVHQWFISGYLSFKGFLMKLSRLDTKVRECKHSASEPQKVPYPQQSCVLENQSNPK